VLVVTTAGRPGAILDSVKASRSSKEEPMAAVQRTAEVDWTGSIARGSGHASGASGALGDLPITVASRFGKPEGKTSPEELIAAAHSSCYNMAFSNGLTKAGTPPQSLDTTAEVTFVPGTGITSSHLTVRGVVPGIDAAAFVEAAEVAKENCPVSQALAGVKITLDASLA
jgi:lipoyl-dependent peroxiredoxin